MLHKLFYKKHQGMERLMNNIFWFLVNNFGHLVLLNNFRTHPLIYSQLMQYQHICF